VETKETGRNCALILGGHVNGYTIIRELSDESIHDIVVFDNKLSISRFSNKIKFFKKITLSAVSLRDELFELKKSYNRIIIYVTDDLYFEYLIEIYEQIKSFCFLPFNINSLENSLNKSYQYRVCDEINIPYPDSIKIENPDQFSELSSLKFPIIIKPLQRNSDSKNTFKNIFLKTFDDLNNKKALLQENLDKNIVLLASEYIPGSDSQIFAYVCYRTHQGEIINEWMGQKLSQFPDSFGIFASAKNCHDKNLLALGRKFVNEIDAYGFIEPEFKFDKRDGRFKLMECNFRPMMWHRIGCLSGVKLLKNQYEYALGKNIIKEQQETFTDIRMVLMMHEIPNLLFRKKYIKIFLHNVFGQGIRSSVIWNFKDPLPAIFSVVIMFKIILNLCLRRLNLN
jgi:D-aspartate ligase